jgi:transcriptional regulator with XRE-family HTH domain
MKLATYLSDNQISDAAFAAMIGRDRSVVSRYRNSLVRPSLDTIRVIHSVTGGAVSYMDFEAPEQARAS